MRETTPFGPDDGYLLDAKKADAANTDENSAAFPEIVEWHRERDPDFFDDHDTPEAMLRNLEW